jgi:peptide/nickel transport system substrate-binding protein
MIAKKILGYTIVGMIVFSMLLSGCAPAAPVTPVAQATEVQVVPTQPPEATMPPAPTDTPAATATTRPTDTPFPTAVPTVREKPQGELVVALTNDIAGITPSNAPEWQAGIAAAAFFDGFFFYNPNTKQYEPDLAQSCEPSADYKTFIFKLKPGLVFQNLEPVNADAVVYSYATLSKANIAYPYPGEDQVVVKKIDDLTVEMDTVDPRPRWCIDAPGDIIPPKYTEQVGLDAFLAKPIGTGPFIVKEWVRGSHVTGTSNPNYWRKGYPKVATITFKFIPDSSTRIAALKTGEVNIITRLNSEEADTLRNEPNINVVEYPVNRVYYVAFNNVTTGIGTPIIDKNVRLALNYAVDKQAIIDALFNGKGRIATGFVTPGDIGFDPNIQAIPYDPDKAKQMLADAGYPDGFETDLACPDSAYSHINEVCQAVAGYLEDVGLKVNLDIMESGKFWDLEGKEPSVLPPLFIDSWSSSGDPMGRVNGAMGKTGAYRAWYDQRIQDLIDKINATGNMDEINQYYAQLQQLMQEDPPFIYLYEPYTFEATSTNVVNYRPRSNEFFTVWDISIK